MALPTLTTELSAVNEMLSAIGEQPVNSLTGTNVGDVTTALTKLREVSRELQSNGWEFNTEIEYPLSRNEDNHIPLPTNLLKVLVMAGDYPQGKVTTRGARLYDTKNHTFVFESNLEGMVVLLLEFTDLPEPARRYITIKAVRAFAASSQVGIDDPQYTASSEASALAALKKHEADVARAAGHNIFKGPALSYTRRR